MVTGKMDPRQVRNYMFLASNLARSTLNENTPSSYCRVLARKLQNIEQVNEKEIVTGDSE